MIDKLPESKQGKIKLLEDKYFWMAGFTYHIYPDLQIIDIL